MHRRGLWVGVAVLAGVFISQAAWAVDAAPPAKNDIEPPNGVPFNFRTGFYTEVQFGFFTVFGGANAEKPVSNGQAFEAISIGYEFKITPKIKLSVFATGGYGANAGSCLAYGAQYLSPPSNSGLLSSPNGCETVAINGTDKSPITAPENFSLIPIELGVRVGAPEFLPRMFPYGVVTGGYTIITPQVFYGAPGGSGHFGVGGGVQYGTRLDGLSVGLELLFRYTFSPGIGSLAIYPRVAYVF